MVARPVTRRRRPVLAGVVTAVATLAASGALLGLAPVAHASGADNSTVLSHLNSLRESHGLRPLTESSDLMSIAASWSAAMSRKQNISHNPGLTSEVPNWEVVGENVGMGPSAPAIDTAFDHSAPHLANELSSAYTQVGIGTARDSRGYLYITVDFRKPLYASPAPAPAKAPVKAAPTKPKPAPTSQAPLRTLATRQSAAATRRAADHLTALHAAAAHRAAVAHAQQARVAAVRASAADETAGTGSDPVGRALSFSRTLTSMAG